MSAEGGADPLRRTARRRPEATAAEGPAFEWSYRRLDREASLLARRIRGRLGAESPTVERPGGRGGEGGGGPRVAAFLPRRPAALAAVHAVPRAGAVLAPLPGGWTRRELAGYLSEIEPDLLLGPRESLERAADAGPEAPGLPLRTSEREASHRQGRDAAPAPRPDTPGPGAGASPDPIAGAELSRDHSLVPTSGSTGRPRAVRLTWRNHLASARGARRRLGLSPDDRWLASLSLAHVGGLALAVRAAVVGSTVVLRRGFDADALGRLVDEGRVSHASLVPVMLRRLLEARGGRPPPDSFRVALVGGAATDDGLLERALAAGVPVALTYGLSEACSQVATAVPELVERKPGTAGPPLSGVDLRIGDEDEILVRGPTVSPGYLDGEPVSPGGWLRTGDAGRLDEEGHLWVTGRLSERIVTGGTTVHPSEIEEALREHPGVEDVAALGVPDPEWGEIVGAAVVPAGAGPDREELERHCRERLSTPRRPRRWTLVDELPRLPGGKIDRRALLDLLSDDERGRRGTARPRGRL